MTAKAEASQSACTRSEVAVFETSVVPRYLSLFGTAAVGAVLKTPGARVCHLGCRTGYPDAELFSVLGDAHFYGVEENEFALELARVKARALPGLIAEYRRFEGVVSPYPKGAFSHAITLHPSRSSTAARIDELGRIVAPNGQAIIALPLRGSFVEVYDLLVEYFCKEKSDEHRRTAEQAALEWPTEDTLRDQFEGAGFEHVEVVTHSHAVTFSSGIDFVLDPITRRVLLPEIQRDLRHLEAPLGYVRQAIDTYWASQAFDLTVRVGLVTGRRR